MPYFIKDINPLLNLIINNDIIFLQEMFSNFYDKQKYIRLKKFCIENKYNIVTSDKIKFFSKSWLDGGLMIITKYPISSFGFTNVFSNNIDFLSDKGILYCETIVNNKSLLLFTTHLQRDYMSSKISICKEYQLKKIFDYVESIKYKKNIQDILISGDFNCDINIKYNSDILNNIFKNFKKYYPELPTFQNETIDYFITNLTLENTTSFKYKKYSDHRPISSNYYI
tara:strand:- start:44 stop:721 length:678 start_codon:yes stop_codon:yes gene_type:complete